MVNKNNFFIAKTFKFNNRIDVYQIKNNNIEFLIFGENIYSKKYEISMGGIKWEEKSSEKILEESYEKVDFFYQYDNNTILFLNDNNCYLLQKLKSN